MRCADRFLFFTMLVLATTSAKAGVLLTDDFESYADTAALQAVWNDQAGGLGTLDGANGNPGNSMAHPGGTTSNRVFAATVPTDAEPIIWEFDFLDDGVGNKRLTGGLRDNGGGAGLNSLLEMGRYNNLVVPEGGANVSGYGVRTVFIDGLPAGWVAFEGTPAVQQGWHNFKATIRASDILFELDLGDDGTVDAVRTITTSAGAGIGYNVARFGGPSNLSSPGGGGNFDNLVIRQVPEPTTGCLLAAASLCLALGSGLRRRRR